MNNLIGFVVDETYKIEKKIGGGAFGDIYVCRDITSSAADCLYACKVVSHPLSFLTLPRNLLL